MPAIAPALKDVPCECVTGTLDPLAILEAVVAEVVVVVVVGTTCCC